MPASPQLGVAEETTYGTYVAPTVGVPFVTESATSHPARAARRRRAPYLADAACCSDCGVAPGAPAGIGSTTTAVP